MIRSFKHKGLEKFFLTGVTKGIQVNHVKKLRMQLLALDTAISIDDIDIAGFKLHQLLGNRKGIWSITVSGNWRITFKFVEGHAYIVNYEDYH